MAATLDLPVPSSSLGSLCLPRIQDGSSLGEEENYDAYLCLCLSFLYIISTNFYSGPQHSLGEFSDRNAKQMANFLSNCKQKSRPDTIVANQNLLPYSDYEARVHPLLVFSPLWELNPRPSPHWLGTVSTTELPGDL